MAMYLIRIMLGYRKLLFGKDSACNGNKCSRINFLISYSLEYNKWLVLPCSCTSAIQQDIPQQLIMTRNPDLKIVSGLRSYNMAHGSMRSCFTSSYRTEYWLQQKLVWNLCIYCAPKPKYFTLNYIPILSTPDNLGNFCICHAYHSAARNFPWKLL